MDLSAKLARLAPPAQKVSPSLPPARSPQGERIDRVRRMLDAMLEKHRRAESLVRREPAIGERPRSIFVRTGQEMPGDRRETPFGAVQVKEQWLPPDHCHGKTYIARALAVRSAVIAALALDPALEEVSLDGVLFLDTETTGLSGGTGTIPFLIGLARFDHESLGIEQLLLATPGEEEPMLRILAERIEHASLLVTYNGKSFDWPLLATRLVLHRVPCPRVPPHFDLLHAVRRIYKRRIGESRLVRIEEELLGMRRERDVDGFEIPALYWSFVRDGGTDRLAPVLEHNANDLVALAAILAKMGESFEQVIARDDPVDHLGRAEVAMRAGDRTRAYDFALASSNGGADEETTSAALALAAKIAKKSGAFEKARALYEQALAAKDCAKLRLELAKLCEHKLKDHATALEHARSTLGAESPEANAKRLARLDKRLRARAG